jgi:signal transduction histidine kinase
VEWMSTAAIVAAAVAIAVALIGAVSLWLSDRRKRIEENRQRAIEAYRGVRTAWDQAQIADVTLGVRREKLQEARRGLVEIELLIGRKVQTKEMGQLLALLDQDLLSPAHAVEFALTKTIWPEVEKQLYAVLMPSR